MDVEYKSQELNDFKTQLQVIGIGVYRAVIPEYKWMIPMIDETFIEFRMNFLQFTKDNPARDQEVFHFGQLIEGVHDIFNQIKCS